jgi:hypothetical protein
MGYFDHKYPIVKRDPTVNDCIDSMRLRDYAFLGGITSCTWAYGYITGRPVRYPTASTAAVFGFTFACLYVLQDTRDRLLGLRENSREVRKYGADPNQTPVYAPLVAPQRQDIFERPKPPGGHDIPAFPRDLSPN